MTSVCVSDWRSRYSASWILYAVFTVTSTAPILVAAQKVMYQAGTLVAQTATLLPGFTPMDTNARAKVSTSSRNSSYVRV